MRTRQAQQAAKRSKTVKVVKTVEQSSKAVVEFVQGGSRETRRRRRERRPVTADIYQTNYATRTGDTEQDMNSCPVGPTTYDPGNDAPVTTEAQKEVANGRWCLYTGPPVALNTQQLR
ncbi:hypothetical protein GBF38_004819 [Nibea albiflora]|uniref:Uncharacterized protein n=1 Tax=Nibea albiflora TaxID=240163 RepID=A0ACB7EG77_NIBAL|nr:hypothetical protein GBF38_004819 [Nibea albiflora]